MTGSCAQHLGLRRLDAAFGFPFRRYGEGLSQGLVFEVRVRRRRAAAVQGAAHRGIDNGKSEAQEEGPPGVEITLQT